MSKRKLAPRERQKDLEAYAALLALGNYNAVNPAFTKEKATEAFEAMQEKQTAAVQAKATSDAAADDANDSEWFFHDVMQGVDAQAIAQYGKDSNEVQSLGLKKKSEYKKKGSLKIPTP